MTGDSKLAIYAALAGNLAIAVTKFTAFAFTRSTAMLTEAIHSTVDTGNQALLLFGMSRAARPPSESHPFGYGMELYFWAFVVALLIFMAGGAVSIYEGASKLFHPEPITRAWINYLVLGFAIAFEGGSFFVAYREFRKDNMRNSLLRSMRLSKDPSIFAVLLEDGAALAGLVLALIGVALSDLGGFLWADGAASIGIGSLLVLIAIFLATETRSLLTGEAAAPETRRIIREILSADTRILSAPEILTLHLGPNDVLTAITIDFDDDLPGGELEAAARELSEKIIATAPLVTRVFLRPLRHAKPGSV